MKATRDGFGDALAEMGERHDNILALDADLGGATKIRSFGNKFPDRYYQLGIAEANMIGVASGLSEHGFKVFLASFSAFLTGRYDIIRCSIAYPCQPVVLVGSHVGMAIGKDGVTQMGLEDVSLMRALPNMKILNPASYTQAVKVVHYLCENDLICPHYLRISRTPIEDIDLPFKFGKGEIVKDGTDITLFSTGCILPDVISASKIVESSTSKSVRIINISTLKPIDEDIIIKAATETKTMYSIEDHTIIGGLGSAVSEVLTDHFPAKLNRIGLKDKFPESAPPADLYEKYGLSANQISKQIMAAL